MNVRPQEGRSALFSRNASPDNSFLLPRTPPPMEDLLEAVLTAHALSEYGSLSRAFQDSEAFNKASPEQLSSFLEHLFALEELNCRHYTVGLILTLYVQQRRSGERVETHQLAKCAEQDRRAFVAQTARLFGQLDGFQTRVAAKQVADLCAVFAKSLVELKAPVRGIRPLYAVVAALTGERSMLTPVHALVLQLCICAHTYKAALPLLETRPLDVHTCPARPRVRDVHLYFYYAGIAWAANGRYEDAVDAFKAAVLTPVALPSASVLEAYKKLILVSLVAQEESGLSLLFSAPGFPKYTRTFCQPYDDFLRAYQSDSHEALKEVFLSSVEVWKRDRNLGLVKRALRSFQQRHVGRLAAIYRALPLDGVVSHERMPARRAAEWLIVECVRQGRVEATISQREDRVAFGSPEPVAAREATACLSRNLNDMLDLYPLIEELDENIHVSQRCLEKAYCSTGRADVPPSESDTEAMAKLTKTH
ncbi:COP9 signalosome complex subunit 3-like [Schistocerca gregaria]|uniref:COP9 signalosome complex subunit 3-like n=1 Tax=Schistocerca gregaria TaxID=7010 RepID=UPI00211F1BF7|nr:COP9 signalosome complex subunit 3-like [Schistocerca gregaria]